LTVLVAHAVVASVAGGKLLTDSVRLSISAAFTDFVGARHLHVGATSASVAPIGGRDRLSWLESLVVEDAFARVVGASDLTVLVANASVAFHIEGLAESKVLSVVDAFADLVLRDDFSVDASVFLAFVRRFPLGAGHADAAESAGHRGVAIRSRSRRRLDLTLGQVAFHLLA